MGSALSRAGNAKGSCMGRGKRVHAKRKSLGHNALLEPVRDEWRWCLHCGRCYPAGEYRAVGGGHLCPYPDCDGDAEFDGMPWSQHRAYHPEYPMLPERNVRYP
jgi:hypothetical protein